MAAVSLGQVSRGIDRTRVRGNAQPDGLFELTNAYVTPARTVRKRPGFRRVGTVPHLDNPFGGSWIARGLASLNGKLVLFDTQVRAWSPPSGEAMQARVVTLRYMPEEGETVESSSGRTLTRVRMIGVFLGRLYVVAEWAKLGFETRVIHYWLQEPKPWIQNSAYGVGDQVRPSVDNGFVYRVSELPSYPAWAPNTEYQLGSRVQPTVFNGYSYALVLNEGTPLLSSDTEPKWPKSTKPGGNRVKESRPVTSTAVARPPVEPAPPPPPPDRGPGTAILDEYGLGHRGRPGYGTDIGIYEQAP